MEVSALTWFLDVLGLNQQLPIDVVVSVALSLVLCEILKQLCATVKIDAPKGWRQHNKQCRMGF